MDIKTNLIKVINTLNTIEVKGRTNLDYLLGSIVLLERIVQRIDQENQAPQITLEPIAEEGTADVGEGPEVH